LKDNELRKVQYTDKSTPETEIFEDIPSELAISWNFLNQSQDCSAYADNKEHRYYGL
jgi:hypothetical protein